MAKTNNKNLVAVLAILMIILFLTKFMGSNNDRTVRTVLVDVDSSLVSSITISQPKEGLITLSKQAEGWIVEQQGKKAKVMPGMGQAVLAQATQIKPQRLAAKDESRWSDFEVDDSTGIRVRLYQDSKILADYYVGKITYKQEQGPDGRPLQGQAGISGISYLRMSNEQMTYASEGFLSMAFKQPFNSWRDPTLFQLEPRNFTRIEFRDEEGSRAAELIGQQWQTANSPIDSMSMVNFLNSFRQLRGKEFSEALPSTENPAFSIIIEGNNMPAFNINFFLNGETKLIQSSQNPNATFKDVDNEIFEKLFKASNAIFEAKK